MASDDPPQKPKERNERREQTDRIAAIGHRIAEIGPHISAPIRELVYQLIALIKQIQTDNKTTETREKENHDRSFRWIKIGTRSSMVFSAFSLIAAVGALYVVNRQLDTMRIEQRAWIKIEHVATHMEENKPLIADLVIKNIGKTPAKRVDANFMIKTVKRADSPDLKLSGFAFGAFAGILNPDGVIPAPVPILKGKDDLLNPPVMTKGEVVEIKSGEAYIVVFGRLTYFDVYGTSHWIDFCAWPHSNVPGTYSSKSCVDYNNVDDN